VTGPKPDEFLSGETGHVAGIRRRVSRSIRDRMLDRQLRRSTQDLDDVARAIDTRRVLVLAVYRPGSEHIEAEVAELRTSRHDLAFALGSTGEPRPALEGETVASGLTGGKFENLNKLLTGGDFDWLLVIDDDLRLPRHFLDRFIALCELFQLALAQPAQTLSSHAAWRVTRRQPNSLVRETRFVEIGPATAFRSDVAEALTPFPDLRYGWGLDLHWSALAQERGWRLGVVDATPIRHESAPVAAAYGHADAIEEAHAFLTDRPFVNAADAQETLVTHRTLSR
jgi:hypothetical protein